MEVISAKDVAARLSIGRTKLWELTTQDPQFPKPIKLTERRKGFVKSEIDEWLEARIAERDGMAS